MSVRLRRGAPRLPTLYVVLETVESDIPRFIGIGGAVAGAACRPQGPWPPPRRSSTSVGGGLRHSRYPSARCGREHSGCHSGRRRARARLGMSQCGEQRSGGGSAQASARAHEHSRGEDVALRHRLPLRSLLFSWPCLLCDPSTMHAHQSGGLEERATCTLADEAGRWPQRHGEARRACLSWAVIESPAFGQSPTLRPAYGLPRWHRRTPLGHRRPCNRGKLWHRGV